MSCSLVVDTNECKTDEDCRFDDAVLQCVDNECVPRSEVVRGELSADETWTADRTWIVDDLVVVPAGRLLTWEDGVEIEIREGGAVVVEHGGVLRTGTRAPAIVHAATPDSLFVEDALPFNVVYD
jgi:hypothetical protein